MLMLESITCVCTSRSSNRSSNFPIVEEIYEHIGVCTWRKRRMVQGNWKPIDGVRSMYLFKVHRLDNLLQPLHNSTHLL